MGVIAPKLNTFAGSGPTKAHRLHLRHVIKQLRALEKRLASVLNKHAAQFLELLADVRDRVSCTAHHLAPFSLLLETSDGVPFSLTHPSIVRPVLPTACPSVLAKISLLTMNEAQDTVSRVAGGTLGSASRAPPTSMPPCSHACAVLVDLCAAGSPIHTAYSPLL
jgi:hypothetical protein